MVVMEKIRSKVLSAGVRSFAYAGGEGYHVLELETSGQTNASFHIDADGENIPMQTGEMAHPIKWVLHKYED